MDFEICFEDEKGYYVIKTSGETTPSDVQKSLRSVFSHQCWRPGMSIMFDNRREDLTKLSSYDIKLISLKFLKFNDQLAGSKVALVMPGDLSYGLARMWELYTERTASFKTSVFRSIENASKWIAENQP